MQGFYSVACAAYGTTRWWIVSMKLRETLFSLWRNTTRGLHDPVFGVDTVVTNGVVNWSKKINPLKKLHTIFQHVHTDDCVHPPRNFIQLTSAWSKILHVYLIMINQFQPEYIITINLSCTRSYLFGGDSRYYSDPNAPYYSHFDGSVWRPTSAFPHYFLNRFGLPFEYNWEPTIFW
jgi:hypothetical protein